VSYLTATASANTEHFSPTPEGCRRAWAKKWGIDRLRAASSWPGIGSITSVTALCACCC